MYNPETRNGAVLVFDSFDGGGPEYSVIVEDNSIVTFEMVRKYNNPDHDKMCGSAYDVIITVIGLKQGKTSVKIECRSPIADNYDALYDAEVAQDLSVTIAEREKTEIII